MAVFMARGYKDPFHRHVSQSLANYFSEQTKDDIRSILEDNEHPIVDDLRTVLKSETVTAWGAKSDLNQDRELFRQMSRDDWFLMRTARPTEIKYMQQVDLLLGEDTPQKLREQISEVIWGSPDYDLLWFSTTPVVKTEMTQEAFADFIRETRPDFEFTDWFPSQTRNFSRIDDEVIEELGGEKEFLEEIADHGGEQMTTGVDNYFILNSEDNLLDVEGDHRFDFEQKSTPLSDEILAAENNGKVFLCNADEFYAIGRIGSIEGKRRDGSLHKVVNILDWKPIRPIPHEAILSDLSVSSQQSADQSLPPQPSPTPIARITEADFQQVVSESEPVSTEPETTMPQNESDPVSLDSQPESPQVFMMPVNRDLWLDDFKRTVDQPFDFDSDEDRPEVLADYESTRIWGTRTGDRNEAMWGKLEPGDIMLFYTGGWFFAAGRIDDTLRSNAAGEYIWDNTDSQFIYTLREYERIAIPRSEVWEWFDYSDNFTRRGLARVSAERVDSLRAEVDDFWEHILEYAVDTEIEAIIEGEMPPELTHFILKTGWEGYEDEPDTKYHFKEGIPGSKQLREAAGAAKFVYLEDEEFYAKGKIGEVHEDDRDGTTHYFADIEDYEEIDRVSLQAVREDLKTDFPIQYGIIKIPRQDYEIIFADGPDGPPEFEQVESYDSVEAAVQNVLSRLDRLDERPPWWFADALASSIIADWTTAIQQFDPESPVDPGQVAKFEQIRQFFQSINDHLQSLVEDIKTGHLEPLSDSETLFLVLLQDLQNDHEIATNPAPTKLHHLLHEDYQTTSTSTDSKTPSHPLVEHLETHPEASVYRFTAPPEYWLTTIATSTISFEQNEESSWDRINPDDVVIFYCQETDLEMEADYHHGVIGGGVVQARAKKPDDDPWWWDEYTADDSFPFLVAFDQLYFTGQMDGLVKPDPIGEETLPSDFESDIEALTDGILPYSEARRLCNTKTGKGLAVSGTFSSFRDGDEPDHERPRILIESMADRLTPVPPIDMHRSFGGGLDADGILDGLYFEGNQGEQLVEEVERALRTGKHIIFTGPPGTGKTEIARRVANQLVDTYPYLYTDAQLTTATADWSTFDTVGGYMPDGSEADSDELDFSPGVVFNRFKQRNPEVQRNDPIIIDELNRADIDKAFGQLFTLLSGQSVQLPYQKDGHEIELLNVKDHSGLPASHEYVVPESWRIFATMNTYDKTSLYEMSYAFMRRFAFIRVSAPDLPDDVDSLDTLMGEYAEVWDIEIGRRERRDVGRVWQEMNNAVKERAIGPAIVEDILAYVSHADERQFNDALTRAIISYIFPQLEGVPKREHILRQIASVDPVDEQTINDAATDMLQVSILSDE